MTSLDKVQCRINFLLLKTGKIFYFVLLRVRACQANSVFFCLKVWEPQFFF